jgi:hypothetical protein
MDFFRRLTPGLIVLLVNTALSAVLVVVGVILLEEHLFLARVLLVIAVVDFIGSLCCCWAYMTYGWPGIIIGVVLALVILAMYFCYYFISVPWNYISVAAIILTAVITIVILNKRHSN